MSVDEDQLCDLLYHVLETEHGGVRVYEAALDSALNGDLR